MNSADGWSQTTTINYSCGEFYEKTFDFNQTVTNLPAGTYGFAASAFQRPGTAADSYTAYAAGTDNVSAFIYAGSDNKKICNICSDMQTSKLGGSESTVGTTYYVPFNMQAASIYFGKGLYSNLVYSTVNSDGASLKVGIRSNNMGGSYWAIFDSFHLYYYGSTSKETLLGIGNITAGSRQADGGTYSLTGQKVDESYKGIVIRNGKKVMQR